MSIFQNRWPAWSLVALWSALIWYGSSLQIGDSVIYRLALADKLAHTVEYAVFGMLLANALLTRLPAGAFSGPDRSSVLGGTVLVGALWGWVDEIHQYWVPGRTTDPLDMLADLAGALLGGWLLLSLRARSASDGGS